LQYQSKNTINIITKGRLFNINESENISLKKFLKFLISLARKLISFLNKIAIFVVINIVIKIQFPVFQGTE